MSFRFAHRSVSRLSTRETLCRQQRYISLSSRGPTTEFHSNTTINSASRHNSSILSTQTSTLRSSTVHHRRLFNSTTISQSTTPVTSTTSSKMSTDTTKYETYPFVAPEKYAGKLKGKVAIVTGTSVGIGRAIAKAMAAAGASVACVARRESALDSLVSEIKAAGGEAIPIVQDVAARGAAVDIVSKTEAQLGPVDILINNAAISRISPLAVEDSNIDLWWRVHEVNVRAPVALTRAVLPGMIERNGGIVLSISSGVATAAYPVMSAYASSKAAITKFHELIVPELKDTGVLSFAVCPGMVKTELGVTPDAINKSAADHPAMKAFMASISTGTAKFGTTELSADTVVATVADERFKVLNGHHFSAQENVERVLLEAEKEGKGRIGKERLHLINIGRV